MILHYHCCYEEFEQFFEWNSMGVLSAWISENLVLHVRFFIYYDLANLDKFEVKSQQQRNEKTERC